MNMAGVVIDPETGHPRVVCVRTNDGVLRFAYEVRHQGGMAKLLDVPPDAMAGRRVDQSEEADLQATLRDAAISLAAQLGVSEPPEPPAEDAETLRLRASEIEREKAELEQEAARALAERNAAIEALDKAEEEQSAGEVELATVREQLRQAEEARALAVAEAERLEAEAEKRGAAQKPAGPRTGAAKRRAPAKAAA